MLPPEVHRVVARGKPYYYWHPGRGTKRAAGKPVRLPDPEKKSREFWIEIDRLGGQPEFDPASLAVMLRDYAASSEYGALSEATRRDYKRYVEFWTTHLGKYKANDIRTPHIVVVCDREYGDKPSTANHSVAVLSAAYIWGIPRGRAAGNPCRDVPKRKVVTDGRLPWPPWALEIAHRHFRPELRRAVALGLYTGQRISDVLKMRRDEIEGGGIFVRQSKTQKGLFLPFHEELKPEIEAALATGREHLIHREDGRPFSSRDFQAMWSREMAKEPHGRIRREGYSFHGLRTLAVAVLATRKLSSIQISAITGQSLSIIERYLKDHRQRELAAQAMKAWENAPPEDS